MKSNFGLMPNLHPDDASAFIVDYIRRPRNGGYSSYGYEIYLPHIIVAYIREVEKSTEHISHLQGGQRARALSPAFYEAAWILCRRGLLRPGVRRLGEQATDDGSGGNGYSFTSVGRQWLESTGPLILPSDRTRLTELFGGFATKLGPGFVQRASEAGQCHNFGSYLACCAMCGAAAESILLAVAIAKTSDEGAVLSLYRATGGRRKTIERVLIGVREGLASQFRNATGLLSYWRDEASHGGASSISEIEAHEALARLLRFAQFTADNWLDFTHPGN